MRIKCHPERLIQIALGKYFRDVGLAAADREPHQNRYVLPLKMGGAAQCRRVGARAKGALTEDALGVEGSPARVRAVDRVRGRDEVLVDLVVGEGLLECDRAARLFRSLGLRLLELLLRLLQLLLGLLEC